MRDLEYRGAGNILGTQQSGFISAIGFDLYCDLLHETIAELKGEKVKKPPDVEVHNRRDAYFPENYIPDAQDRVLFYRRLSETVSPEEVDTIKDELYDRYGRLEELVVNLIETAYIRHYAAAIGASEISFNKDEIKIFIPENIDISRDNVEKMVQKSPVKLYFSFNKGMIIRFYMPKDSGNSLKSVKNILQVLAN